METKSAGSRSRWPFVVALLGLGVLALAAFIWERTRSLPGEMLEEARSIANDLRSVAAAFSTGTITTTFVSYAAETSGSQHLQFATLKEMEVFERTDRLAVLWGQLELPEVVVRAEAPVEYTYYLDLEDRWQFLLEGNTVRVVAPAIEYNTPAVDVSRIRYEVKTGSVLRNEEEALENLRRGITGLARKRAAENTSLVRDLGRKQTEEFVRTWLLSRYDDAASYRIEVFFADEAPSPAPTPSEGTDARTLR
ncbi:MAG: hypothetical protein ACRD21_02160 [Vicinamibacteria bacterium]